VRFNTTPLVIPFARNNIVSLATAVNIDFYLYVPYIVIACILFCMSNFILLLVNE
jgi:type III secretory pathway component EscR